MPLKLTVDAATFDQLDDGTKKLYVKGESDDAGYTLDVEDLPNVDGLKSALSKERGTVRDLKKQLGEVSATWDGLDRAEIDDLLARRAELEKADPSKIEEQIKARVQQNDAAWKDKYGQLEAANKGLHGELSNLKVRDALRSAGAAAGVGDGAQMDDFVARGERTFRMNGKGEVQPLDAKGEITYGKDGVNPLTMQEFAKGLAETAPHLFKSSNGGGASGSGDKGAGGAVRYRSDLKTNEDRVAYIREHGQDAYLELPRKAPDAA